ncbi:hypothetical protein ACCI51_13965 [Microbulbifer echini]|uniref:Uncharacterized protein n=1 Tax=Microbulbifer echini TaxID=1529067 RepID=A0ABV4NQ22_9GAMM
MWVSNSEREEKEELGREISSIAPEMVSELYVYDPASDSWIDLGRRKELLMTVFSVASTDFRPDKRKYPSENPVDTIKVVVGGWCYDMWFWDERHPDLKMFFTVRKNKCAPLKGEPFPNYMGFKFNSAQLKAFREFLRWARDIDSPN